MLKNVLLLFFFIATGTNAQIAPIHTANLPNVLEESSGLAIFQNLYYTHNDGGNPAEFYAVDSLGNLISAYTIAKASNIDWEAMQISNQGDLLIGDIGNNGNNRQNLRFYLIRNFHQQGSNSLTADTINFSYNLQSNFPPLGSNLHFDSEGFIVVKDSILIFSKNRSNPYNGFCYVNYVPLQKGTHTTQLIDSINTGAGPKEFNWITDATWQNNTLWLLSHGYVLRFDSFKENRFSQVQKIMLSNFSQKEACAYQPPYLWITDEYTSIFGGQNLYQYLVDSLEPSSIQTEHPISDLSLKVYDRYFELKLPSSTKLYFYSLNGKLVHQLNAIKGNNRIPFNTIHNSSFILKATLKNKVYTHRFHSP